MSGWWRSGLQRYAPRSSLRRSGFVTHQEGILGNERQTLETIKPRAASCQTHEAHLRPTQPTGG